MRTRELMRVGVVNDNVAVARQRRHRSIAVEADRPGQADRAVLVRIFQTCVDQHGGRTAVELLLEIFFGDSRNRHAANCRRPIAGLSTGVVTLRAGLDPLTGDLPLPIEALAGDAAREGHDAPALAGYEVHVWLGGRRLRARRFVVMAIERPSRRSTATMDAPQKNRPRLAPHPVLVAAGQIAVEPIPHTRLSEDLWPLPGQE